MMKKQESVASHIRIKKPAYAGLNYLILFDWSGREDSNLRQNKA